MRPLQIQAPPLGAPTKGPNKTPGLLVVVVGKEGSGAKKARQMIIKLDKVDVRETTPPLPVERR